MNNCESKIVNPETRYIPLKDWHLFHPWPSVSGLRWYAFHSKTNGFHRVLKRVGRRLLINEAEFFSWIEFKNKRKK